MQELRGRVVVITGAGGIGSATALAFAREGCRVALCDVDENSLHSVRELLAPHAGDLMTTIADVSDGRQMREFIDSAVARWGRLDVLVNNAAYGMHRPFIKVGADEIQAQLQTNYMGAVHATKAALEHGLTPDERGSPLFLV